MKLLKSWETSDSSEPTLLYGNKTPEEEREVSQISQVFCLFHSSSLFVSFSRAKRFSSFLQFRTQLFLDK